MQETKKLLEEKDNTIQVLKKKLKFPNAEHVQSSELFTFQEEKEKVYQEMMDYKGKSFIRGNLRSKMGLLRKIIK